MIIRTCRKCGCMSFVISAGRPYMGLLCGGLCGCPMTPGKYKEKMVSDGILVVLEEEEL